MRRWIWAACGLLLVAATATPAAESEKKSWYETLKLKGDLRLRYEKFDWDGNYDNGNRDRLRYRLRFGLEAKPADRLRVGFELRSGNPNNPHSDNQSFDGGFTKKTIAIAQAYAAWNATDNLEIWAGKFAPKNLWTVSDFQWDDDVISEGVMERLSFDFDGAVEELGVNLYQFVLEESGSGVDAYLFGGQVAPEIKIGDANKLVVGAGYDSVSHPERVTSLTLSGRLANEPEDTVTNLIDPTTGRLVSDFRVANAFFVWSNKSIEKWPAKLSVFFYKNLGAGEGTGSIFRVAEADAGGDDVVPITGLLKGDDNDTAMFVRLQVGDYKKPGRMAFRWSWYDSEPDAMFYPYVQSDTRRGTNSDGWRFDWRLGMPFGTHINLTWYHTDFKEDVFAPAGYSGATPDRETMDRWQLDYIFKF